jgi:hypothetical protein
MAGAGAKKFPAFSKLSSDDVNNYLADQVIMRFATTTARDAAFGGVGEPTLAEGMTAYIDADNSIYTYDGSNWVRLVSTTTPPAMQLVSTFTASGTSRSLVCDNVFTTEFDNYRVVGNMRSTVNTNALFYQYLNTSGVSVATGYYGTAYGQDFTTGGTTFFNLNAGTVQYVGYIPNSTSAVITFSMDIYAPKLSTITTNVTGQYSGISSGAYYVGGQILGTTTGATEFRGLTFDNGGAGNLTGSVSVYGYRK